MQQATSQIHLVEYDDPFDPIGGPPLEVIEDRDPIFEAFGDYDAFGPFAWREADYLSLDEDSDDD